MFHNASLHNAVFHIVPSLSHAVTFENCCIFHVKMEEEFEEIEITTNELDLNDLNLSEETTSLLQSEQPTPASASKERKLVAQRGEIGYMKGGVFIALTNFSVKCIGYVTRDANSTTVEGYLVDVIPKDSVQTAQEVSEEQDLEATDNERQDKC